MDRIFHVGVPFAVTFSAPQGRFGVVFEDDGDTGYAYAIRRRRVRSPEVLDALHLYNVTLVKDRDREHSVEVRWSPDGTRAAVLLNGHVHAAIAFAEQRAGCMNAFPPPSPWCRSSHQWDPALVEFLEAAS